MQYTTPEYLHKNLAGTARTFSFIAVISALFQTVIFPYIFGGLAIIFAVISKGNNARYQVNAKIAIWASVGVILLNSLIIGASVFLLYNSDTFTEQLNTTYEQLYGVTFDEYSQQLNEQYGISPQ